MLSQPPHPFSRRPRALASGLCLAGLCWGTLVLQLGCLEQPKPIQDARNYPVTLVPPAATLTVGRARSFAAAFGEGPVSPVVWGVLEPGGGSVDASGAYQAPGQPGTFTLQARCQDAAARPATARITVVPAPRAEIVAPALLLPEASGQTASVAASPGSSYTWTVTNGLLIQGADGPALTFQAGTRGRTVLACKVTNPAGDSASASLSIPISAPVSLAIRPAQVIITQGREMKFGFDLKGGVTLKAAWRLGEPGCGSLDADGKYVAPETPGLYTVRVASVDDPRQVAIAQVKVVRRPPEDIFGAGSYQPGAQGLTARVADVEGMTYAWTVKGGTLTSAPTGRTVTFTAGDGPTLVLRCVITNEAGDAFTAVRTLEAL